MCWVSSGCSDVAVMHEAVLFVIAVTVTRALFLYIQSLEEIEVILAKAERSMNQLKCKIAAESQCIRFASSPQQLSLCLVSCCMCSRIREHMSLVCFEPGLSQASRGVCCYCKPASRAHTLLAEVHRLPTSLGEQVGGA